MGYMAGIFNQKDDDKYGGLRRLDEPTETYDPVAQTTDETTVQTKVTDSQKERLTKTKELIEAFEMIGDPATKSQLIEHVESNGTQIANLSESINHLIQSQEMYESKEGLRLM